MEQSVREEEWYAAYQEKQRSLEQILEGYERKNRKFEQKQEHRQSQMRLNQERMEESMADWGSSREAAAARAILEEYLAEEKTELKKEAEALQEERRRIRKEQSLCEEMYQAELQNLLEEAE